MKALPLDQGLPRDAAELLWPVVVTYRTELNDGCMITIKSRKVTCHLLAR